MQSLASEKQHQATSGNVSVKLAMSLFDSKVELVLTYGSIIWGIESNINSITINGLKEDSEKSTKEQVLEHLKLILTNPDEQVRLDIVKRMGRKHNSNSNAFSGIQLVQDNFIKFTLNLPKNCSNFISRSEVGKYSLKFKIWTQMVKYFLRLCQS